MGWTTVRKVLSGEIPPKALLYRIQAKLGSKAAELNFIYLVTPDPWKYTANPYESEKYQRTLEMLPQEHYRTALEIACSIGIFTKMLAPRVEALHAIDISLEAIKIAKKFCAGSSNIRFEAVDILQLSNHQSYDLITCAEMMNYVWKQSGPSFFKKIAALQKKGGNLILVSGAEEPTADYEKALVENHYKILSARHYDHSGRPYRITALEYLG